MIDVLVIGAASVPGEDAFYAALLAEATYVVAADGGAALCRSAGRVPDVVVGDMDSAPAEAVDWARAGGADIVLHPSDKDTTDLELAIDEARGRFGVPVTLTAAFSARLDHTLAALGALTRAGASACAREPRWTAFAAVPDAPVTLAGGVDSLFSVIAVGDATGVNVTGAKWPLVGATVPALSGLGVSNLTGGNIVRVSVEKGTLVVYVPAGGTAGARDASTRTGGGVPCGS